MGPCVAGRGKPRPLLAGVYRKACDYCVRSKRGCNGGTPCEQCIRRGQGCTYSQRRKSGPRGRPARPNQQQNAIASSPKAVGTRTSVRRINIAAAAAAAVCPGSSSSFSDSMDDCVASSDDSDAAAAEVYMHSKRGKIISSPPRVVGDSSASRRVVGSSPQPLPPPPVSRRNGKYQPVSPYPFVAAKQAGTRGDDTEPAGDTAVAAVTAPAGTSPEGEVEEEEEEEVEEEEEEEEKEEEEEAVAALEKQATNQKVAVSLFASSSSSSPSAAWDEASSCSSKNKISVNSANTPAVPPRKLSPLNIGLPPFLPPLHLQRSASLPMWARETSADAQARLQGHHTSASVGAVLTGSIGTISSTSSASSTSDDTAAASVEEALTQQHQQQRQRAQVHQPPAFAAVSSRVFMSKHWGQPSMPPDDPMDFSIEEQQAAATEVAAAAAAATAGGAAALTFAASMTDGGGRGEGIGGAGASLKDMQENDDLDSCPWQIPSLTREGSLARVVAALGADRGGGLWVGVEGSRVGVEGSSFVTAW